MASTPALPYLPLMTTDPTTTEADALLIEAIGALRASGRIVQKIADGDGGYRVDGGPALTDGAVVVLAWDTGLMGGSEGMQ